MDYHISKPLRRKELVEAISCALGRPGAAPFPETPAAMTASE
jgi:hypothetical protein